MTRRVWLWSIVGLFVSGALLQAADESLHIVPTVSKDEVVVSFEGADVYTEDVRAAISSGLRTTFTYDIALRMHSSTWVDRTVATALVTITDEYDNLTRRHRLSRAVDGRVVDALVTEDEAVVQKWLTTLERVPVCATSKLDASRDYYVRIIAQVRPQRSIIGWASSVTGSARFTFIP